MRAFYRIALDIGVAEQPFLIGFIVVMGQADDDDMDMRLAPRLAAPAERPVREEDFQMQPVEQDGPKLRDLLALGDRVGRNESDADAFVAPSPLWGGWGGGAARLRHIIF